MTLADGEAADGVTVEADLGQALGRFPAQVLEGRALLDAEQGLGRALPEGGLAARRPAGRQLHGGAGAGLLGRPGHALVELHDDVGAQQVCLNLDRAFGRKDVFGAVDMALERHLVLGDLGDLGQGHDLETAAIGQDRPLPAHEPVQPAQPRHPLGPRPQHQVVGVAEDDVGPGLAHLLDGQGLDRGGGADGHEGGGADIASRRAQHADARLAVDGVDQEREGGHRANHRLESP